MRLQIFSFLTTLFLACSGSVCAQSKFNGNYFSNELNIRMKLNLDAKNIPVPGLEMDSCYGYLQGNINGGWVILKIKEKKEEKAIIRAISERGADAQDLEVTLTPEGDINVKQIDNVFIKGIGKNKYVKLPKPFTLQKQ